MPYFRHQGRRIYYQVHGAGDRPLVLIHGLLMNGHMFDRLGPDMAARGNRVIVLDLLGHGGSDSPPEMTHYSMTFFAHQVVALLDHLELAEAAIGGTSLGANVTLETARIAPERVKATVVEMPVLDNALVFVAALFTPIMLALRFGEQPLKALATAVNRVPRSHYLVDILLDWLRRDPATSVAVLVGLMGGRSAPHHDERVKMQQPALVVGHSRDPLHPFSDSGMLTEELPNARLVRANSILEWRLAPERLNDELARFLDDVWRGPARPQEAQAAAAGR
jgi:pimeloyl-ACP methyl ester carboxylesterase